MIDNVFKFPKNNIMKICFSQTSTAKKATDIGLLAFNMSIPSYNIKTEEYIPINTCFRCYKIDHFSNKCPEEKSFTICSECGSKDHTWRNCKTESKCCINCGGAHSTLAFRCPMRKKIREEKLKEKKEARTNTYSQAASKIQNNQNPPTANTFSINLQKDTAATILTCMLHAHMANIANPGSYNKEMNELLKQNKLPQVNLPDNPPSKDILHMASNTVDATTQNRNPANMEEEADVSQEDINEEQEEEEMPALEDIRGKDLGLEIITKRSEGWPKETMNLKHLIHGIDKGKYKWLYTNTTLKEEQVMQYIKNNEINLKDCWRIVDDQQFRKIRNGQFQERTPPDIKNRHRKLSH